MGDNNETTKVVLDLDNDEFVAKLKDSLGLLGEFGKGESIAPLIETLTEVGAVVGVATAAFFAFKTAIDLNVEAEKINQINKSFEALAKSVGLSGSELKEGLLGAAKGLVDETDLLEGANKAIVKMGENASRLPEIMELARKATVVFGGDLMTNFNDISTALASGNARMLRHYGLIIDASKAQEEYAKTLGISKDYLDDTGKRMAIMNAALEQGKEKFANIDESTLKTTNNLQRMGAEFKELKEIAIVAWDKIAGPYVSSFVESLTKSVHGLVLSFKSMFADGAEKENARREILEQSTKSLEQQLAIYKKVNDPALIQITSAALEKQKAELDQLNAKQKTLTDEKAKTAAADKAAAAAENNTQKKGIDYDKLTKDRDKFEKELIKLHKETAAAEEKTETDVTAMMKLQEDKKVAIAQEAERKIAEIKTQYKDKGVINQKQYADAVTQIEKKKASDMTAIDMQTDQARLKALTNLENANKKTTAGITAGFKKMGEQSRQDFMNMSKAGERAFSAIGNNAVSAFKALGNGSKDASSALKGFFLGALGDIAEQQGEAMLLMGLWPPNPVAIAGGGALIALGAAMKAAGDSSGSSSSSVGGGGGYSSAAAASSDTSANAQPTPAPAEKKTVTVSIAGNYFETDQTRTRLMDMIREAGDFTDFNLKQIGQP